MSAEVLRTGGAALRFGDWGPGYLSRSDDAAFGVIVLRPGDAFDNHLHEHHTETFIVLEGSAEVFIDRDAPVTISAGDLVRAEPREEHLLRNPFDRPFRAVFVKTPCVEGDKIDRPWSPDTSSHS